MNRTDQDECYDPGKVSPVDRAMPREDDFGGIMYWADDDREIDVSEGLKAATINGAVVPVTNHRRKQQVIYYTVDSREAPTEPIKRGMWIIPRSEGKP